MKFSDFINEKKSVVIKNVVFSDGGTRVGGTVSEKAVQVIKDSVDIEYSDKVTFSVTPVLENGDDKDIAEVVYVTVAASFDINASRSRGTYDTPEDFEFEIDKKSIDIESVDVEIENVDDYDDSTKFQARTKDLAKNKELLKEVVLEIFEEYNDIFVKKFTDENS